ncbi:hypothetical protein ACFSTE_18555 [Aquimarina hainanensis]|uniref:Uncharacterized protein n=1 Tax=Aquimarina hainanensis TaxID=1578017 RepID=A0ABW5NDC1_9FLAO
MAYPKLTIQNNLSKNIVVYDAFQEDASNKELTNYFGTLTDITSVSSDKSASFEPIHGPISTYIIFDETYTPITRVFSMGDTEETFTVTQEEVDIMTATQAFVTLLEKKPDDTLSVSFQKLIKGGKATADEVNTFFKNTTEYKSCTFISYMLAVVALARTPKTKDKPPQEQAYSLSTLCTYMGFDWPSELPDITISDFSCTDNGEAILIGGVLTITDVTFADGVLDRITTFLPSTKVTFGVEFIYKAGLSVGVTCLTFGFESIKIPIEDNKTFDIDKPTVLLTLNPLFKFVVFEIKADIPFTLFNSPTIDAEIAMTIDNIEAEIGVELSGNKSTLLTPPGIKGLHFDSFGVGLGLFFEPPGFAIGVDGSFHIGEDKQVSLNDDQFAIVCQMEEEIPNPLYLSFYVPTLSLEEVIAIFTDTKVPIDFPISFSDLSFRWAENPMEPVVLPDGSLAPMGYGFSGYMDLFGLGFYGYLNIDMNTGISGDITMDPFSLGSIFRLSGDGKEVSIKVDASGTPIPNNAIPKTAAEKKVIDAATDKTIIKAGGPEMTLSTSSSPYFTLDAKVSLLEVISEEIDATISKEGIHFELDYGTILQSKMSCTLQDYHNFSGSCSYGIDLRIPLPTIAGFDLGSIHLDTGCSLSLSITTSTSDIVFKVQGAFTFEGLDLSFGPFELDVDISSISAVIKEVEKYILRNVSSIFEAIIKDASKWAGYVEKAIVSGVEDVAEGLKTAFDKSATEVASIMHGAGYGVDMIASGLKTAFSAPADVIASALKDGFGASDTVVTDSLKYVGFGAEETAKALNTVFGLAPDAVYTILKGAGYAESAIKDAFESIGGAFADAAKSIWHAVSHWDHWS